MMSLARRKPATMTRTRPTAYMMTVVKKTRRIA